MSSNKIKAVLFDLDGTLLPMDLEEFFREYFKLLDDKLAPYGYGDPRKLAKNIYCIVEKVVGNDGSINNGELFKNEYKAVFGDKPKNFENYFDDFYNNEFLLLKSVCGFNSEANKTVKQIKQKGLKAVIATKPIFPASAIEKRMEWAGVDSCDFEYYTSYEECSYCKPNPQYYKEIADRIGLLPEDCLMVGNDVSEDMPAEKIGMKVFLLTDCLINYENKDINQYPNGSFSKLLEYIETLA